MGEAPCELGVPEACGFLWEEAARGHSAQRAALEAQEGEIPPPLSDALTLPLARGPNTGDPLNTPWIPSTVLIPFRELDSEPCPAVLHLPRSNFHLPNPWLLDSSPGLWSSPLAPLACTP